MTAVLKITDGTNEVSLLGGSFYLAGWRPAIAQYKNAGSYVDSPLSEGRRIVYKQFANVAERFDLKQRAASQDEAAEYTGQLFDLLERASDHWLSKGVISPVYLEARSSNETNTRYAVLISGGMVDLENPYSMPFLQPDCAAVQDNLVVIVERMQWQSAPPGETDILQLTDAAITDNLIGGGSFELAPAGVALGKTAVDPWWTEFNSPTSVESTTTQAHSGRASVKIVATAAGGTDKGIYQDISGLTQGKEYTITARALIENGIGSLIVYDGGGFTNAVRDDTPQRQVERLDNPDFETDINNWKTTNLTASRSNTFAYGGTTWSARLQHITPNPNIDGWFVSDKMTLTTGNPQLSLNFAARVETAKSIAYFMLQYFDAQGALIESILPSGQNFVLNDLTGWQIYSLSETPPSNAVSVRVAFQLQRFDVGIHDMYVDEFSLEETLGPTNPPDDWLSMSVAKTAPAGGSIRVAVATKGSTGGTVHFDTVRSDRDFGMAGTTAEKVFFSNYQAEDNISHIFIDDGGVFGNNLLDSDVPYNLFPAVPASGDAIYFGSSSNLESHSPFASLLFDVGSIASEYGATSYTYTWEYRGASSWVALDYVDNTDGFQNPGRNSISWSVPGSWDDDYTVNSVPGYWIRCRITALTGTLTPPSQHDFHPHVIGNPFFEIDDTQLAGDLKALAKYTISHEGSPFLGYGAELLTAGADDIIMDNDLSTVSSTDVEVTFENDTTIGLRFQNITIPQGARIRYAWINFLGGGGATSGFIGTTVYGEDADDSAAWSGTYADNVPPTRTYTSEFRYWNLWDQNSWNAFDGQTTIGPGVKEIVQEIVDRSNWASGNAMSFFINFRYETPGAEGRDFLMYETSQYAWQLVVEWVEEKSYTTSLLMGSRRTSRGENFRSHFNFIEDQPDSITLTLGNNATIGQDAYTLGAVVPRNQHLWIQGLTTVASKLFTDRGIFRIHAPLSAEYAGRFRAFARAFHPSAQATPTKFRLRISTGAGGVSHSNETVLGSLSSPELLDLGIVTIPDVGTSDYIEIALQVTRVTDVSIYVYDIILIPIDEWAVELSSMANSPTGMLDGDSFLEIDGISPAQGATVMTALLKNELSNTVRAQYIISGGRPILDNRATQRVYCLAVTDTGIGGASGEIENVSLSNAVFGINAEALQRYLGLRGAG
jgi:hypothetical protein